MSYHFIIVGAGIAGLTIAIALEKEGYHVKVIERRQELKDIGAGLGKGFPKYFRLICTFNNNETVYSYQHNDFLLQ